MMPSLIVSGSARRRANHTACLRRRSGNTPPARLISWDYRTCSPVRSNGAWTGLGTIRRRSKLILSGRTTAWRAWCVGGVWIRTKDVKDYEHPSHRGGMAPGFGTYPGAPGDLGRHRIGFRVVQAPMPDSKPQAGPGQFCPARCSAKPRPPDAATGSSQPYFRKRHLLPMPPDNAPTRRLTPWGCLRRSAAQPQSCADRLSQWRRSHGHLHLLS